MADGIEDPPNALGAASTIEIDAYTSTIKKPTKKCEFLECGKFFVQNRKWQRFCSVFCRNKEFWSRHKRATIPVVPEQQPS